METLRQIREHRGRLFCIWHEAFYCTTCIFKRSGVVFLYSLVPALFVYLYTVVREIFACKIFWLLHAEIFWRAKISGYTAVSVAQEVQHLSQMEVADISCYSTCGLNASELGKFLAGHGIDEETVQNFIRHEVCGDAFSKLTEKDFKELVPLTGIRVQMRELRRKVSSACGDSRVTVRACDGFQSMHTRAFSCTRPSITFINYRISPLIPRPRLVWAEWVSINNDELGNKHTATHLCVKLVTAKNHFS